MSQQALQTARHCRALMASEAWQWFQATLQTRMDRLTREVMESHLTENERTHRIQEYRLLQDLHHYPETHLQASLAQLEAAGGAGE